MKNNLLRNAAFALFFLAVAAVAVIIPVTAATAQNIIPKPNSLEKNDEVFSLTGTTIINCGEFRELANYLNTHIWYACDYLLTVSMAEPATNCIVFKKEPLIPAEGYRINITSESVELTASTVGGMFYAVQTLLQMMPAEVFGKNSKPLKSMTLSGVTIVDSPRFEYRGVSLDVSRTFFDKQTVMRYIDWMSRHKLNKLHWHLTDDNGWRIEIKSYPELTSVGAWRGPDEVMPPSYGSGDKRYGGFYTQNEVREIVAYAAFRNIEIIPEIDLPGHSQVLTHVYPETFCRSTLPPTGITSYYKNAICVGREENYEMLRNIFSELAGLFPSKYIHIGGDEVSKEHWKNCSRCKDLMRREGMNSADELLDYFVRRMEGIVGELGKETFVWNEAVKGGKLAPTTVVSAWESVGAAEEAVRAGQRVVMMPGTYLYIDMKYGAFEQGHTWAGQVDTRRIYSFDPEMANMTAQEKKLVLGVEAALFGEILGEPDGFMEYQSYPKLCALAEVGWTQYGKRDYDDFYRRLTSAHLERLGRMGVSYRLFPPQFDYVDGRIIVENVLPGAETFFTTDGTEPTPTSNRYIDAIDTADPWKYRFKSYYFGGASPVMPVTFSKTVTLRPGEKQVVEFPVAQFAPKKGIWYMNVVPGQGFATINRLEVSGVGGSQVIIGGGQAANPLGVLRLYVTDKNISSTVKYTITNNAGVANPVTVSFRLSEYIEPAVSVQTSLSVNPRYGIQNLSDYNHSTYTRSSCACKEGDYITYTFAEPVKCSRIEVRTGIPGLTRYIVTDGEVLASADGLAYKSYGKVDHLGAAVVTPPDGVVKSVRINIKGGNYEPIVAFQNLFVIP